ncbi:hypothetical protein PRIPAC_81232 [Pristionchus pacificus]|uniref:Copper transport protein n=1 Tax=Pristionchus pacificus TaxID=54126 RepID=A0A2A6BE80_PRIPA|nr:hypothetical protein PRIPAC_81232 [Pristionchus pacificus]|eukprot:PDM64210.1 hypothetical protein PRIPAC_54454 [Pristionchus pacificus]
MSLDQIFGCDHGNSSHMDMMDMTLHFGTHETVLFKWWKTESIIGLLIACFIWFLIAFFYEGIKGLRFWLATQDATARRNRREEVDNLEDDESVRSSTRLLMGTRVSSMKLRVSHAFLHGFQSFFGLILMLVAMTFNVWIILAVSIGMAIGFFVFHGAPNVGDNANDCC